MIQPISAWNANIDYSRCISRAKRIKDSNENEFFSLHKFNARHQWELRSFAEFGNDNFKFHFIGDNMIPTTFCKKRLKSDWHILNMYYRFAMRQQSFVPSQIFFFFFYFIIYEFMNLWSSIPLAHYRLANTFFIISFLFAGKFERDKWQHANNYENIAIIR